MNKVILIGRLTSDPEVRYTTGNEPMAVARYTLAVDRRSKGENTADFIRCIAFRKSAEFAEKYLHKGMKIAITGHIQTGSYKGNDGKTVYTTDIVVEDHEFCESKAQQEANQIYHPASTSTGTDGFMSIPDGLDGDELPFA